jgi:hypothetical protein
MSGPRPGEIRCPTCHRSTPPAAFCTNCGSPIPSGARVRPRGLDREELQARIRARRSGQPYLRRGGVVMPGGEGAFEPYEPEEGDELHLARSAAPNAPRRMATGLQAREADPRPSDRVPAAAGEDASPRDLVGTDDEDPSHRPFLPPARRGPGEAYPTAYAGDESDRAFDSREPDRYPEADPGYDDPYAAYAGPYYAPPSPRTSSGAGPFLIVGFLALGVLALLAGGALAFLTGGDEAPQDAGIAGAPTETASATETPEPTQTAATPTTTAGASGSTPSPTANPSASVVFPDGFRAQAQPCRGEPANGRCPASGAVVSAAEGQVWILVTFEAVKTGDLIAVSGTGADGRGIGDASWPATGNGSGYSYFAFALPGLRPGEYQVEVTRNGQHAATTIFRVEG